VPVESQVVHVAVSLVVGRRRVQPGIHRHQPVDGVSVVRRTPACPQLCPLLSST
jgi:hypothetical protein